MYRIITCTIDSFFKLIVTLLSFPIKTKNGNKQMNKWKKLRIYEKIGSGMEWHVDDALYDPEQIECVLTIENNSDCLTKWDLRSSNSDRHNDGTIVEVETEANSAIFIRANGVPHFVSSLKTGYRSILKFVFIQEGSTLLDDAKKHLDQFTSSSSSPSKKNSNKNRRRRKR